jgi:hypothetical protein
VAGVKKVAIIGARDRDCHVLEMNFLAAALAALRPYLWSCGVLLLPIFVWNAALTRFLPGPWSSSEFSRDIPAALVLTENLFRWIVLSLPFLMPLDPTLPIQRRGLVVFGFGAALYCASWLVILAAPDSRWSSSVLGFLAPAYTPLIWLVGLAMLGQRLYWEQVYRWWMYLAPVGVFIAAHVGHAALVYARSK